MNDFFIGYEQYQQNLYLFKKLFIYSISSSSLLFIYNTKHPYIIFLKKIIYRPAFIYVEKQQKSIVIIDTRNISIIRIL